MLLKLSELFKPSDNTNDTCEIVTARIKSGLQNGNMLANNDMINSSKQLAKDHSFTGNVSTCAGVYVFNKGKLTAVTQ